jgi:hypothetical protein
MKKASAIRKLGVVDIVKTLLKLRFSKSGLPADRCKLHRLIFEGVTQKMRNSAPQQGDVIIILISKAHFDQLHNQDDQA